MREASVDYLIVGGGLAGFNAATTARKYDQEGSILLVGDEPHLPYDRVPLSKDYLHGKRTRERVFLRESGFYAQQRIAVSTGRRAVRLDAGAKSVELDDGTRISFRRMMLATGVRARALNVPGVALRGVHTLRTLDDCERLRSSMLGAKKAVVIGGGFVGCEVASIFASAGIQTTIVEAATHPLNVAIDQVAGGWVADYFRKKGVRVITGAQAVELLDRNGAAIGVRTSQDETIPADIVAVGIGVVPNSELAESGGLKVDRGIVVSERLETSAQDIFAGGDVARFHSPIFGTSLRVEHFDVAAKHGAIGGANMTGKRLSFVELPFFYSYAFDLKLRAYGDFSRKTLSVRRGGLGNERGFFQMYFHDDRLIGFISINGSFEDISRLKQAIMSKARHSEPAKFGNPELDLGELTHSASSRAQTVEAS